MSGVFQRDFVQQSEQSHFINIYAPSGTKVEDNLPVLIWIYGGSLNHGSSSSFIYDPTEWIRRSNSNQDEKDSQKFIVVTLEYRTNIFGKFSLLPTSSSQLNQYPLVLS